MGCRESGGEFRAGQGTSSISLRDLSAEDTDPVADFAETYVMQGTLTREAFL